MSTMAATASAATAARRIARVPCGTGPQTMIAATAGATKSACALVSTATARSADATAGQPESAAPTASAAGTAISASRYPRTDPSSRTAGFSQNESAVQ